MANNCNSPDVKPEVTKAVEETPEPLKYKKWVLKVSVHCEGCKRKVKRVLHSIEGVYTTEIDLKQQKVTVNGNVEAETLIKKLVRTGKHAELWPVKAEKKQSKSKNKNSDSETCEDPDQSKSVKIVGEGPDENSGESGGGAQVKGGAVTVQVKGVKPEVRHAVLVNGPEVAPGEKGVVSEGEGGAGSGGGGSGGRKKKKKKGQKGNNANSNNTGDINNDEQQHPCDVPAGSGLPSPWGHFQGPDAFAPRQFQGQGQGQGQVQGLGQGPIFLPANHSPPRQHPYKFPFPPQYYAPPVYAVGYHTAHPTTSYARSYYAPQAASYSRCYESAYLGEEGERPPLSDPESYSPRPSRTFELFSDENPNACSVM